MVWSLELVLGLFITTPWIRSFNKQRFITSDCPCDDTDLCWPLHRHNQAEVEVFAFHFNDSNWKQYDWSKITTIVVAEDSEPDAACTAHANNARIVLKGMSDYIRLGIDSRKLVMGVAWYGYDYTCKRFLGVGECELETISQGVPCSYTKARRIPYKDIMQRLPRSLTGRFWDVDRKAPYFDYLVGNTYHEVWYDDPESISMKVSIMMKLNLCGIGVWAANNINYTGDVRARMQAAEMWNAVCRPWWNYRV
ncbi:di-N-acetylchitobiase-like [Hypanus sabinus]|uniref:di-N-acetylchitobiase-like n=1 Tax=Hypanus sabinus TaxID=79690 RepID=UPI0028C3848B|nr:di-N-acetylchitobiase-like [Hypanus sabinus]